MMKQVAGTGMALTFLLFSCGKKFMSPNGNQFLGASVTASPLTVAADSLVTISGQGFSPDPSQDQVFFNGAAAAVLQANMTQLVVKVPAAGSTGSITVRVSGEQASGPLFTYPGGSKFSISPSSGVRGTTVTLTGNQVGAVSSTTVNFGNLPGKVVYTDSTRIIVTAPDSVKTSALTINTNGKEYAGPVFTICTIASISPAMQGAGAGTLQIIGTGFNPIPGQNTVSFPTNPSTRVLSSDTVVVASVVKGNVDTLIVNIPTNAGTGHLFVNPNGQNTIAGPVFTLFAITSVAPVSFPYVASSGFLQVLTGNGFNTVAGQNHLTVNGIACTVSRVSPTGDSIFFYPPDVVAPSRPGTANGAIVLQSGGLTTTFTALYSNQTTPTTVPVSYVYQEVSTLAGGVFGLANGRGRQAQFETLSGITTVLYGSTGTMIYVTDKQANNVRAVTPDGVVTLVAGSPTGQSGYKDGIGAAALFDGPSGVAYDQHGNLFVADSGNFRIRQINLSTYQVTTVSGTGAQGSVDGAGASAQFIGPNNIVWGGYGLANTPIFYITDVQNGQGSIRQLTTDGIGTTTTVQAGLANPGPVFVDISNNPAIPDMSYLSDQALYNQTLGGVVAGVPGMPGFQNAADGTTALFNNPSGLVVGNLPLPIKTYPYQSSTLLISDRDNNVIRVVDLTNQPTTPYPVYTYIGGAGGATAGFQDGGYRTALFDKPGPLAFIGGSQGTSLSLIYVCDVGNHAIRVFN